MGGSFRKIGIAIALLAAYHSAAAADWETKDSALLGGALGLIAIDWAQTRKVTAETTTYVSLNGQAPVMTGRRRDFYETNPLLGSYPSTAEINRYFIVAMSGTALLSYLLPAPYRRPFLGGVIVLESALVIKNHRLGLRWDL